MNVSRFSTWLGCTLVALVVGGAVPLALTDDDGWPAVFERRDNATMTDGETADGLVTARWEDVSADPNQAAS